MLPQQKVEATQTEIRVVGTLLIVLGMIPQTIEFFGWIGVLIDTFNGSEEALTYSGWTILGL